MSARKRRALAARSSSPGSVRAQHAHELRQRHGRQQLARPATRSGAVAASRRAPRVTRPPSISSPTHAHARSARTPPWRTTSAAMSAVELPHPEPRIEVPPRVRARRRPAQAGEAQRDVRQVQQRDALGRPVGRDAARLEAPELLGVRAEEAVVERPPEARDHPVLEARVRARPRSARATRARAKPATASTFSRSAEVAHEVDRLERVAEAPPLVQDHAPPLLLEQLARRAAPRPSATARRRPTRSDARRGRSASRLARAWRRARPRAPRARARAGFAPRAAPGARPPRDRMGLPRG